MIICHPHSVIFNQSSSVIAKVTVCISLYNYADYIGETLESVTKQTLDLIDLVIVDDCSQDNSLSVTLSWLQEKSKRFNRVQLIKHNQNSGGPSGARNTAISLAQTPFVFMLDADNLLYPRCIMRCLETLENSDASLAYPLIERFGAEAGIMGNQVWSQDILACGNYIDTMALIRKSSIEAVNGYSYMSIYGWEDFDLWCKFIEKNYYGILVPEILARYRVHKTSLTSSLLQIENQKLKYLTKEIKEIHPWLKVSYLT